MRLRRLRFVVGPGFVIEPRFAAFAEPMGVRLKISPLALPLVEGLVERKGKVILHMTGIKMEENGLVVGNHRLTNRAIAINHRLFAKQSHGKASPLGGDNLNRCATAQLEVLRPVEPFLLQFCSSTNKAARPAAAFAAEYSFISTMAVPKSNPSTSTGRELACR